MSKIEKIPFGQGFLQVELKRNQDETKKVTKKDIDPYTLYVGNLPMNVTKSGVVQYFNSCTRIDIGHPKQMKNSRYAFVRFSNVDDAISCYKRTVNMLIDSRSMIVRFRRINGVVGLPGENKGQPQPKTNQAKPPNQEAPGSIKEKTEKPEVTQPDLSLVKAEPAEQEEQDVKPSLNDLNFSVDSYDSASIYTGISTMIPENQIKKEEPSTPLNEDEVEAEEDEEYYDAANDNFIYKNEGLFTFTLLTFVFSVQNYGQIYFIYKFIQSRL